MTNAPSSIANVLMASRMGGSMQFRSTSLIPANGLSVSCRLFSITDVESPITRIVPVGWPSYPSAPISIETWIRASTTCDLNSGPRSSESTRMGSSSSSPSRIRTSVSRVRSGPWPARARMVSPSFTRFSDWQATSATLIFSTRE